MNADDPSSIPLRDIHLPDPIGWWPPAPGWSVLVGLLVLAFAGLAFGLWHRHRRRLQRAALMELNRLEENYLHSSDPHAYARGLSMLARRVSIALDDSLAAQTGQAWLDSLDGLASERLTDDVAKVLLKAPYSPKDAAEIAPETFALAVACLRGWLAGTARSRRTRGTHA